MPQVAFPGGALLGIDQRTAEHLARLGKVQYVGDTGWNAVRGVTLGEVQTIFRGMAERGGRKSAQMPKQ